MAELYGARFQKLKTLRPRPTPAITARGQSWPDGSHCYGKPRRPPSAGPRRTPQRLL